MVHSTSALQPSSVRLLLALAVLHGFDLYMSDVHQAYLQYAEAVDRRIFFKKLVFEYELDALNCFQLLKPLFGLCEFGYLWHQTLDHHQIKNFELEPLRSDPTLYTPMCDRRLRGLSEGCVDDRIQTVNDRFNIVCAKTWSKSNMADDQNLSCFFTGFALSKTSDGLIFQDRNQYLLTLEELPKDCFLPNSGPREWS